MDINLNQENESESLSKEKVKSKNKESMKKSMKFKMNNPQADLDVFKSLVKNLWTPLNKKVILPTEQEIESNPRARSAKLRVAVKN